MPVNEKDIMQTNLNNIDMEFNGDDEDDFFGIESVKKSEPIKTISADFNNSDALEIKKSWEKQDEANPSANLNSIDMECDCCDDDDDTFVLNNKTQDVSKPMTSPDAPKFYDFKADFSDEDDYIPKKKSDDLEFTNLDDDEEFVEPELTDESLNENKEDKIDQGTIESNYLDKLAKKHKATNVKGSYNTSFHFAGNPEQEKNMFNHDMTPNTNVTGANASGNVTGASAGGDGGATCGESVEKETKTNLLEDLLVLTGFKLIPDKDNFILKDKYDFVPETRCKDKEEVLSQLRPYINDMIITPLQYTTGEKFNEPEEWCNWYTPEMETKFPKCKSDINYCKMLCDKGEK